MAQAAAWPCLSREGVNMTDLEHLIRVIGRMTVADWANGIASMALVVGWTLYALSRGAVS